MRFFRQWRRRVKKKKKGLFGGAIKSQEEIEALNKKIEDHEKVEFEAFEKGFDQQLKNL